MMAGGKREERRRKTTAPHCHSDHIASFVSPTAPLLLSRSRAHPIHSPIPHKSNRSVARFDSVPFDSVGKPSVASRAEPNRTESGQRSEGSGVVGCVARHGGPRRRWIGVEGRRRGRRPGRGLGLAHHPAASLLRLHLPLLRVGPPPLSFLSRSSAIYAAAIRLGSF